MDYYCLIQSVVAYIENRLKTEIDLKDLERVTGFSLAHNRDIFKKCTQMSLSRYLNYRRISHAAFEMAHTDRRILDIACDYGFDTYDTFTRAFKRVVGVTPQNFRALKVPVGRIKLTASMFGPGILHETGVKKPLFNPWEEKIMMKSMEKSKDTCVLYGVPKVKYCYEECTPFPSALKACLNYMGQDISYSYLMASTGASFRLRWHLKEWDGGNVDIMAIYENPWLAFEKAFQSAGRQFKILEKTPKTTKEAFMDMIKSEIDAGRPVIALGIIGPPEACIVTGYRDGGHTLLGWNFFQDNPEFAKDVIIDESGYFICSTWWENPETRALISIGESQDVKLPLSAILKNAMGVMANERIKDYAGGRELMRLGRVLYRMTKNSPKRPFCPCSLKD